MLFKGAVLAVYLAIMSGIWWLANFAVESVGWWIAIPGVAGIILIAHLMDRSGKFTDEPIELSPDQESLSAPRIALLHSERDPLPIERDE